MNELIEIINKKDKTIDNKNKVVIPPSKKTHQPIFAVIENTADYIFNESDDSDHLKACKYICIRTQLRTYNARLRQIRSFGNETNKNAEVLIKIDNSNAINFKLRLKDVFDDNFKFYMKSSAINLINIDDEYIKKAIKYIHDEGITYGVTV